MTPRTFLLQNQLKAPEEKDILSLTKHSLEVSKAYNRGIEAHKGCVPIHQSPEFASFFVIDYKNLLHIFLIIMALFATRYLRSITSCNHLGRTYIIPQRAFSSSTTNKSAAVLLAVSSVTRQLIHHPGVQVNKSNRSMVPEVDSPELSHAYGDKFISKSVLRKVANIQKRDDTVNTDRGDVYTTEGDESINLKSVGLEANRG
nr:ribosome biogenesis NEP1-like protein [Tanacetum cinerariifolium]